MDLETVGRQIREGGLSLDVMFHPSADESAFSLALYEIADRLRKAGGDGVALSHGNGEGLPAVPALTVRYPASGSVNYLALPQGPEAAPFMELLASGIPGSIGIGADAKSCLRELNSPADIVVFISAACPNCPQAVRAASQLAAADRQINTTIIDVEVFPRLAERFKIRSVPMTVIDGDLLINEVISARDLAQKIVARRTDGYRKDAFLSQVNTGNFAMAAERLVDEDHASYFLTAWQKSTLSTRIALLLTANQAL
ncbi:MAG: thioredoxin family protein, partial [Candidatus Latescibacterota bacterium]